MNTYRNMLVVLAALSLTGSVMAEERGGQRGQASRQTQRDNRPPRDGRGNRSGGGQMGRGDVNRVPGQRESGQFVNRKIGLILNTQQAWPGYTLFAPKHNLLTYLIDNQGRIINSWTSQYEPGQSVYMNVGPVLRNAVD